MAPLPRRAFVVAAHPDDDTIGCGGFISLIAQSGGAVRVAYLSDGSRSHPGSVRFPPAHVAHLRASEARAALTILGVAESPVFFALPDGGLGSLSGPERAETVDRLAREISAFAPDLVLALWPRDPHPDHVAASAIASAARDSLANRPKLAFYAVWLPIRGTVAERPQPHEATTCEIGLDEATQTRKREAILAHRTQTSALIDDDPSGFRIDESLLGRWTGPSEAMYEPIEAGRAS